MKCLFFVLTLTFFMGRAYSVETPVNGISPTQDLELRLIGAAGQWNAFEGKAIEAALRSNKSSWRAAMLSRGNKPLIRLRDLPAGDLNADTLHILVEPGKADELEKLAGKWAASELRWLNLKEASEAMGAGSRMIAPWSSDQSRVILQLWWD